MMFVKHFISYFSRYKSPEAMSLEEAYKILSPTTNSRNEPKYKRELITLDEDYKENELYYKTGTITAVKPDGRCVIDNDLRFTFRQNAGHFQLNSRINFQVMRQGTDFTILNVVLVTDGWNDAPITTEMSSGMYFRTMITKLEDRKGRDLYLTPGNVVINLDDVHISFVPVIGDWLELKVRCTLDENELNLAGNVINCCGIIPVRSHLRRGKITNWDATDNRGIIDRSVYFNELSLFGGYIPAVGDMVIVQCIESDQEKCKWRALKMIPDNQVKVDVNDLREAFSIRGDSFVEDHADIDITNNLCIILNKLGDKTLIDLYVFNKSEKDYLLKSVYFLQAHQCRLSSHVSDINIRSNSMFTVQIECTAKSMGATHELCLLEFDDSLLIGRWINLSVGPSSLYRFNEVKLTETKRAFKSNDWKEYRETIRCKPKTSTRFRQTDLPQYQIPSNLANLFEREYSREISESDFRNTLKRMKPVFSMQLTFVNYEDRFHTLVFCEEMAKMSAMRSYDHERIAFAEIGEYLTAMIDNIAERRPSVIVGDKVIVRSIFNPNQPDFEGAVEKVTQDHLYIAFPSIFRDAYKGEDYAMRILPSRTTFRREHVGISQALRNLGKDILFPTKVIPKEPQVGSVGNITWFNSKLNTYQKQAVVNVLSGVSRPLPYVIFGPPGTGKTVVLVEIILQLIEHIPDARLLIVAPSNSATNVIALRLIDYAKLKPGDLVRIVSINASSSIPPSLAPYTVTVNVERSGTETVKMEQDSNGILRNCPFGMIGRHRITVTTCSNSGVLHAMGLECGHFSHIICDEAGQTSEPSLMIPLSFLDRRRGQAVLAGDPMQLGPVILSKYASEYGMEESYLERLLNCVPYLRDVDGYPDSFGYDPRLVTKLIYNYRSLAPLLKLPSSLFYHDELQATLTSDSFEYKTVKQVKEVLPSVMGADEECCLLFHGIVGQNMQKAGCTSWFNPHEAAQVFFYVNELYRMGLTYTDIGIITPYKSQAKQLGELFKEAEFDRPKIGTVEEFQGQEFLVIIISLVRTTDDFSDTVEEKFQFVSNYKRLNVAITRARALLIIVGNPLVFYKDRHWKAVIDFCTSRHWYIGCKITE